jgi:excisionase family DNA binding protein
MEKKYLTLSDAVEYTGLAKQTLYNFVWQKRIPHYKPSRRKILFKTKELDAWIEEHFVPSQN